MQIQEKHNMGEQMTETFWKESETFFPSRTKTLKDSGAGFPTGGICKNTVNFNWALQWKALYLEDTEHRVADLIASLSPSLHLA